MHMLVLLLALLPVLTGADSIAAVTQRRTWTWFGAPEAAASAKAISLGRTLAVVWRDGSTADVPGAGVQVAILAGTVIEARDQTTFEGCRDATLIPLLGLTEAAVVAEAQRLQRPVRVVWRDGMGLPATMDYHEARLNLHVTDGIVVAISGG